MGSCWKCGKELPEGKVECEYGCGDPGQSGDPFLIFQIAMQPDKQKMRTNAEQIQFNRAMRKFGTLIQQSFMDSGINTFCKPLR